MDTVKNGPFLELASLDGALLFTGREILAVGAMIGTHAKAQQDIGAEHGSEVSAILGRVSSENQRRR